MMRLLRHVPIAMLVACPMYAYSGQRDGLEKARRLEHHTYAARRLAVRIKMDAGCTPAPGDLAAAIAAFAGLTADNPTQIRAAAAMRRAAAAGDLRAVATLADAAEAEEQGLLETRRSRMDARMDQLDDMAGWSIGLAMTAVASWGVMDWLDRRRDRRDAANRAGGL
jgi:hypothetical protein